MLPYDAESFDAVTIQGVLHHLADASQVLREAFRVLRPGGGMYISEPCSEGAAISRWVNGLSGVIGGLRRDQNDKLKVSDHEKPIDGSRLVRDLEAMGFTVKAEYLARFGVVRFLPESWRIYPTLLLSLPTRRIRGDLIFISAHKMLAGGPQ